MAEEHPSNNKRDFLGTLLALDLLGFKVN